MTSGDLVIAKSAPGEFLVTVRGRANFEYAVPLRDLLKDLADFKVFRFELSGCTSMDSTFMGVLTMLGMRAFRKKTPAELYGTTPEVKKLLTDLGVAKLLVFKAGEVPVQANGAETEIKPAERLKMAETVAEAHKTLVAAEPANEKIFADVIKYADEDVKKLRQQENK